MEETKKGIIDNVVEGISAGVKAARSVTTDLLLKVDQRMRARVKELKEKSQAKHYKIPFGASYKWETDPPSIRIANLQSVFDGRTATITYQKFDTLPNGNIAMKEHKSVHEITGKEYVRTMSPKRSVMVKETIEYGKPLKVDEVAQ